MSNPNIEAIRERFKNNDLVCEKIVGLFSLLSNKIRFRILCLLLEGEFCVTDIVDIIQIGKISNVSQQLKLLTMGGIIEKRRDKKQLIYSLKNDDIKHIIEFLHDNFLTMESNCEENCNTGGGDSRNDDGESSIPQN
eukprot:Anaeramoba_ignava/a482048_27.p2 GENE.a482048_27~~a482048_27.p2  ORF type:complete len:137 (+),score=13.45 a482048_27:17-427(+)